MFLVLVHTARPRKSVMPWEGKVITLLAVLEQ